MAATPLDVRRYASSLDEGVGTTVDHAKARAQFQKACDAKVGMGCFGLGVQETKGRGIPVDNNKAFEHFNTACAGGVPLGCQNVGIFYRDGTGTAADPVKARTFLEKACDLNAGEACAALGQFFADGTGGPRISSAPSSSMTRPAPTASTTRVARPRSSAALTEAANHASRCTARAKMLASTRPRTPRPRAWSSAPTRPRQ